LEPQLHSLEPQLHSSEASRIERGALPMADLNDPPKSKILIVDDNHAALSAMSGLLEMRGFSVRTAQNGLEALNGMKTDDRISLILLDLWMPVMDGREFLRRKGSDPRLAEIPVVMISAVPPVSLDGVKTVLGKPVHPDVLVDTIRCHAINKTADA
jgi:CheY-like chemotaxis protein